MRGILKLLRDQRGAATIEYALIASLISIAGVTAMVNLGDGVEQKYTDVETAVDESM